MSNSLYPWNTLKTLISSRIILSFPALSLSRSFPLKSALTCLQKTMRIQPSRRKKIHQLSSHRSLWTKERNVSALKILAWLLWFPKGINLLTDCSKYRNSWWVRLVRPKRDSKGKGEVRERSDQEYSAFKNKSERNVSSSPSVNPIVQAVSVLWNERERR